MMIFLLLNICIYFYFLLIAHELHCMIEDISSRKKNTLQTSGCIYQFQLLNFRLYQTFDFFI